MSKPEVLFHKIAMALPNAVEGKLFGALCLKCKTGKTFAIFWKDCMLFKLNEKAQQDALKLEGSEVGNHLYDPKWPMKGWVSIPYEQSHTWLEFGRCALQNVKSV